MVVLVASAGSMSVTAEPGAAQAIPPDRPTRVLAVGDSVMEGAAGTIPGALPGRQVLVDTQVSRSTGATADAALSHGTDWDVVVVLVGHNDADSGVYQRGYLRLLDGFAGAPRVVLLTLHEVRASYPGVNNFLRDQANRRPNVRVADWNAAVAASPGSVAGDGLHLSPSGARLMADLVAGQVQVAESELAPTTTVPPTTPPPPPGTTSPPATAATTAPTVPPSVAPAVSLLPSDTIGRTVEQARAAEAGPIPTSVPEPTGPSDPQTPPGVWVALAAAAIVGIVCLRRGLTDRVFPP